MSIEESTTQEQEIRRAAWDAFQYWSGSRDQNHFRRSYLGHYADRDTFGRELLAKFGADARIYRLPDWLRSYVRLDGEAVARDFERAGYFHIVDAPSSGGTFVFDAHERPDD